MEIPNSIVWLMSKTVKRPSYIYRPHLSIDGDQWCALYGEDLQNGVAGFGCSPDAAYLDFDKAWYATLNKKAR